MAELHPPVIVVPGITATSLEDTYPLSPEAVWTTALNKAFDRIALHPDDIRYEANEPARVLPRTLFGIVYDDLVSALRHELSERADRPTPVFAFPYDWRQDCRRTAKQLGEFVDEVVARTRLLPHYAADPPTRVDLVGHSMGGLVIAALLADRGTKANVRRVVSIGTPFRGSVDAVMKLTTGMGTLTGDTPRDREREAARTITAIYQLLPSYPGAIEPPNQALSLFDTGTWQPSVLQTLREFCRLHKAQRSADEVFAELLTAARELRELTDGLTLAKALPEGKAGWFPIVGIGARTHVSVNKDTRWFGFPDAVDDQGTERTGDGTVPFLGACPAFFDRKQLACVSPEDFTIWEVRDRAVALAAGFHGALPTVNLVQRLATKFLWNKFSGEVHARPAPGVATPDWPSWLLPG